MSKLPDWMVPTPTRAPRARPRPTRVTPAPTPTRELDLPNIFQLRVMTIRKRLDLSAAAMARYLGVPVYTYRKWEDGTRDPSASVVRLLEVLRLIDDHAPKLHNQLIQEAKK